jgi:crotonobetaine/carnitine-CoA ligase
VVGVAGDGGEEEILAILVSKDNCPVDIPTLTEFLSKRLAHFMVPRYFRFTEELPRTPTQKVEKHVLRSIGLTADTQDREALGILLTADKLGKR